MKFNEKSIYGLVLHQFFGEDDILFASDSLNAVQEWFDIYHIFNKAVEIVKIEYYEVQE